VSASFDISWHAYLACSLQYVIVIVDGRGTGYKGRTLRNPVKGNLGFWEVRDQINAARWVHYFSSACYFAPKVYSPFVVTILRRSLWAAKDYVDRKRVGIWGWVSLP
jgi:dipeptidyl aminopeptidase